MEHKPCGSPEKLVTLRVFHAKILELKTAKAPDELKQMELQLNDIEVAYTELASSLAAASAELKAAMKDRETQKKKAQKAEEARKKAEERQKARDEQKKIRTAAKTAAKQQQQQQPAAKQDAGAMFEKGFSYAQPMHARESDADALSDKPDLTKPFIVKKCSSIMEFIVSANGAE
eukprot:8328026-Pyramimonas_sp.AAC.1